MRFYTQQHPHYCGIDLHARTMYLCILNQAGAIVLHCNMKADPDSFLEAIGPYRDQIGTGLMKNDTLWKFAPTADSHSAWKSLANPARLYPIFHRPGAVFHLQPKKGGEGERPVPKTFHNVLDDFRFVLCPSPEPESNWCHEPLL